MYLKCCVFSFVDQFFVSLNCCCVMVFSVLSCFFFFVFWHVCGLVFHFVDQFYWMMWCFFQCCFDCVLLSILKWCCIFHFVEFNVEINTQRYVILNVCVPDTFSCSVFNLFNLNLLKQISLKNEGQNWLLLVFICECTDFSMCLVWMLGVHQNYENTICIFCFHLVLWCEWVWLGSERMFNRNLPSQKKDKYILNPEAGATETSHRPSGWDICVMAIQLHKSSVQVVFVRWECVTVSQSPRNKNKSWHGTHHRAWLSTITSGSSDSWASLFPTQRAEFH